MPQSKSGKSQKGTKSRSAPSRRTGRKRVPRRMSEAKRSGLDRLSREFRQAALVHMLRDIHRILEVEKLGQETLPEPELAAMERQFEAVMKAATGVTREMRALIWLERTIIQTAYEFHKAPERWHDTPKLAALAVKLAWVSLVQRFPEFQGRRNKETGPLFIRYIGSYARSIRRGGPRKKGDRFTTRWQALYELAINLDLVSKDKDIDNFRSEVLRAKRKYRETILPTRNP